MEGPSKKKKMELFRLRITLKKIGGKSKLIKKDLSFGSILPFIKIFLSSSLVTRKNLKFSEAIKHSYRGTEKNFET